MSQSTLTAKGQTTVPKEIRDHLGLKPGDKMEFKIADDGSVRLSARTLSFADSAGLLARPGQRAATIEEMDDAIAEAVIERLNRT